MSLRHFSENMKVSNEVLIVQGILTDDLQFMPIFCHSESRKPQLAKPDASDIWLALLDEASNILLKERAGVRETVECSPYTPKAVVVEGSIALHPGATGLAIRKGGLDVIKFKIGERPNLKVSWSKKTVTRKGKYVLRLNYSNPTDNAMIKIFFQWGPKQYLLAGVGKPSPEFEISFDNMPGGRRCELIVAYSSGLRTTVARTKPFSLALLPSKVEIVRPRADEVFAPWQPVELQGKVQDRQRGDISPTDCVWSLQGEEIGRGLLVYGGFLDPGSYNVQFQYGKTKQSIRLRVAEDKKS